MKPGNISRRPSFSIVMIGVLAVLLPLLAILQYRWIGQVSEAEGDQLRSTVNVATGRSVRDIHDELDRIVDEFRLRQRTFDRAPFDSFADTLAEDYLDWQATSPNPELLASVYVYNVRDDEYRRFDPVTNSLVDDRPPIAALSRYFGSFDDIPEDLLREHRDLFANGEVWVDISVLGPGRGFGPSPQYRMLFEIDPGYLWTELVPGIIATRFEQTDYHVAIENTVSQELLYRSDGDVSPSILADADTRLTLTPRQRQFRLIGPELRIAAQHELGSLAEAVATQRRRNLGIGFGILALLGASGGMIIVWSERVRSVGRLQMEFAAGISHELRTPLATIRTAAHNIASGVISKPEEVREYAAIVQSEGRRLSAMVDQSIQFAQTEAGRRHYDLVPIAIDSVIDRAVAIAVPSVEEHGPNIKIETHTQIPHVMADETALTHCVVNLLTNAIKFGASGEPITIDVRHDGANHRVQVSVHNEGRGIDVDELPHLFEPFYRGHDTASIPGSGLGLSLVRRMMAGQKGMVTVESHADAGATFVLHIPVARAGVPIPAKATL